MSLQKRIKLVILFAAIILVGLIASQVYWIRQILDVQEKKVDESIHIALINVADRMGAAVGNDAPNPNPVTQLSEDYFVVNIKDKIDANILEVYLKDEFGRTGYQFNFEYGIYDCESDEMMYGGKIEIPQNATSKMDEKLLPKYDEYLYYFGIHFLDKKVTYADNYKNWVYSTLILMTLILFFALTISIMLRQKKRSDYLKDFINNITHEFQTPISTIKISSEVLTHDQVFQNKEKHDKYVEIIQEENRRLEKHVSRILDNALINTDKLRFEIEKHELNELILESLQNFREIIDLKSGKLTLELKEEIGKVDLDAYHFKNILKNLMDNAIKYSPNSPEIKVKSEDQNGKIWVSIEDKGIGINKKDQKHIFDRFFRVQSGDKIENAGFGLGLNYVQQVCKKLNWKIEVESALGVGSKFTIVIPK